jgi:hypothetical protein
MMVGEAVLTTVGAVMLTMDGDAASMSMSMVGCDVDVDGR